MPELDALEGSEAAFLAELETLPGSYEGPDGTRPEPYGLTAFGEAAGLPSALRSWFDAPLVPNGTQFLLSPGFDFGEMGPLKLTSEMSAAEVVTLGSHQHEPDIRVDSGPLSLYTFASYLGHATGHHDAVSQLDSAMRTIADRCRPAAPTEINPAKALAWTLWNRVPVLLANRSNVGVTQLVQRVFARVGKSLSIALGEHPLELVTGALEGNHALGDDLLALVIGEDDAELALAREVLGTRVAQVERLEAAELLGGELPADRPVVAMIHWYLALWVAAYLAILHGRDPADDQVYDEVRRVAGAEAR